MGGAVCKHIYMQISFGGSGYKAVESKNDTFIIKLLLNIFAQH
jgi:hypothetical protein